MPDRTIRERSRKSEKLAALTAEAERLWWRLVTMADDLGRIRDNPVLILAEAFPLMADRVSVEQVDAWLRELAYYKLVRRYQAEGQAVVWLIGWEEHQRIAYPSPSELPGPDREQRPGKPGRVISKPKRVGIDASHAHTPAHTRADISVLSGSNSGSNSNRSTGTVPERNRQLLLPGTTGKNTEDPEGGYGGKPSRVSTSRQTRPLIGVAAPDVPSDLQSFDETLRGVGERYRPTTRFYQRIREQYLSIPGLDLEYEAEGMVNWLLTTPKGKTYTDVPRFAENWLGRAAENALRRSRPAYNGRGNGTGHAGNGRPYAMGGPILDETRESARRAEQRSRELGDD